MARLFLAFPLLIEAFQKTAIEQFLLCGRTHLHVILKWSYMRSAHESRLTLADLPTGQRCVLDHIDLPEDVARRLMELGFLPGNEIVLGRKAPGGGPRVYRVDGSEVALRQDLARCLYVRSDTESDLVVLP